MPAGGTWTGSFYVVYNGQQYGSYSGITFVPTAEYNAAGGQTPNGIQRNHSDARVTRTTYASPLIGEKLGPYDAETFQAVYSIQPVRDMTPDHTANTFTLANHGLLQGYPLRLSAIDVGDSLPPEFSEGVDYYVLVVNTSTIQLAASYPGSAIDFSSSYTTSSGKFRLTNP